MINETHFHTKQHFINNKNNSGVFNNLLLQISFSTNAKSIQGLNNILKYMKDFILN